ncbi:MAG: YkgJ family cysteine cluster protein [Draconibacterium sp.]|nr:YkgJ family cysteine cluster protein [Draconibacterium sp.]
MNSTQNFSDIEKTFFSDGYKFGMKALKGNLSHDSLFLSISEMYSSIDELILSLTRFSIQQNKPVECKKGCSFCCHQPVFALDYEMQYLNFFIKENFTEKVQNEIRTRANNNQLKLSNLQKSEILNSKQPCPLLTNSSCLVYEARPMACRIYLSTAVKSCQKFYTDPKNKSNFPALLEFPLRAGRMMNEGFKSALKTKGILAKEFRIDENIFSKNELSKG